MSELSETVPQRDFKDRKTRLTVFGILQIVLGGLAGMIVPFMILGMIASSVSGHETPEGVRFKSMIPAILVYVMAAVWFIWMGIGSLKARRWARALILISSWYWLICGIGGFVFILMMLPNMFEQMSANDQMPKAVAIITSCIIMGFMIVFYFILPGLFVLFYRGKDVKATCEYYDTQTRWTDKCPLPVLGAALACTLSALSMPIMGTTNWVIPFFGTILSGITGAIAVIALCLILAWTAWGLYRLDHKAWWAVLLITIGWAISVFITFSIVNIETYYEKAGMTEQQMEQIRQFGFLLGPTMKWAMLMWAVVVLSYFFWIRKYFINTPGAQGNSD